MLPNSLAMYFISFRKTDAFHMNFYIVIPTLLVTHIVAFGIG
jgi:NADPH-dependent 7-cyano-7-deazaguanine reductase QueF